MSHTVTVLHVTDVHFRPSSDSGLSEERQKQVQRERWKRERVIGDSFFRSIEECRKEGDLDLICFTGDIADHGKPSEYCEATFFFDRLCKVTGLDRKRLFVVPGNHDIDRGIATDVWKALLDITPRVDRGALSDWLAGGKAPFGVDMCLREKIVTRQHAYREWVRQGLLRAELLPDASSHGLLGYRASLQLPDRPFPIHLIGLDSSWLAGGDDDAQKLRLTDDQIGLLATDGGSELLGLRIGLVHHPIADLADAADARRLLADYVDLLLRGHQHEPLSQVVRDPDRGLLELAAGCLYEGTSHHRYPNGYTVLRIETDAKGRPTHYDLRFRSWSTSGHWHDDSSIYKSAVNGRLRIEVESVKPVPGISAAASSATVVSTVRFLPELVVDPVSLVDVGRALNVGTSGGSLAPIAIEWPHLLVELMARSDSMVRELRRYREPGSEFFGIHPGNAADALTRLEGQRPLLEQLMATAPYRLSALWKGWYPYFGNAWTDYDIGLYKTLLRLFAVRSLSMALNGMQFLSVELLEADRELPDWRSFDWGLLEGRVLNLVSSNTATVYLRLKEREFVIKAPVEIAKEAYAESTSGRPLVGCGWYRKYVVPQIELRLAEEGDCETIVTYDESGWIRKVYLQDRTEL